MLNRNGNIGCLVFIIVFWLLFFGGCAKVEKLIDTQTAANEKAISQPAAPVPPAAEAPNK